MSGKSGAATATDDKAKSHAQVRLESAPREDGGKVIGSEVVGGQEFKVVHIPEGVTAEKVAKAAQPPEVLPMCGDGCGERVANKGRIFLSGHDAKLHSILQKVANGEAALPPSLAGKVTLPRPTTHTVRVHMSIELTVGVDEGESDVEAKVVEWIGRKKGWSTWRYFVP